MLPPTVVYVAHPTHSGSFQLHSLVKVMRHQQTSLLCPNKQPGLLTLPAGMCVSQVGQGVETSPGPLSMKCSASQKGPSAQVGMKETSGT